MSCSTAEKNSECPASSLWTSSCTRWGTAVPSGRWIGSSPYHMPSRSSCGLDLGGEALDHLGAELAEHVEVPEGPSLGQLEELPGRSVQVEQRTLVVGDGDQSCVASKMSVRRCESRMASFALGDVFDACRPLPGRRRRRRTSGPCSPRPNEPRRRAVRRGTRSAPVCVDRSFESLSRATATRDRRDGRVGANRSRARRRRSEPVISWNRSLTYVHSPFGSHQVDAGGRRLSERAEQSLALADGLLGCGVLGDVADVDDDALDGVVVRAG